LLIELDDPLVGAKQVELGLSLTQPHMDWLRHELAAVGTRLEVLKR